MLFVDSVSETSTLQEAKGSGPTMAGLLLSRRVTTSLRVVPFCGFLRMNAEGSRGDDTAGFSKLDMLCHANKKAVRTLSFCRRGLQSQMRCYASR